MPIRRMFCSMCAAAVPLAAALFVLSSGGIARPVSAAGQAAAAPQSPPAATAPAANQEKAAAPTAEKTAGEAFKNVQILKDLPASQFMPNMFFIAASLGVGCDHCHVTSDNGPWPMEKDDKKEKKTAREMMKMMFAINNQNFEGRQEVTCATCHNGHPDPSAISPVRPLGEKPPQSMEAAEQQSLPPADQILDRYVEAIGGTAALEKLKTRVIKGALVTESGRTYNLEVTEKAPDLGLVTATSPKGNVSRDGFDGTMAWNSSGSHVFPSHGLEAARIARDTEFFVGSDVKKHFPRRFVAGKETVGGEEAYVVRVVGHGDVSEKLSFSVNSGLLLRRVVLTKTALGRYSEETDYSDYREVDGVKIPFTVERMEVNTRYTEKYSEIKQNVPVSDSVFQMPVGAK
jgi:photosynthetic reaction center cytochrome c subunit